MQQLYKITLFLLAFTCSFVLMGQTEGGLVKPKTLDQGRPLKSYPNAQQNERKGAQKIQTQHQALPSGLSIPKLQHSHTPSERTCFTVESMQKQRAKHPKMLSNEAFEAQFTKHLSSARLSSDDQTVYKIPTIVHIVNYGEPLGVGSNISQEQVMSQFEVLNEDFRRLGAGYNDHPDGADINIEFVPVLLNPEGKLLEEPGINRVQAYSSYYEYMNIEFELKPNTQWDPERYFNIWVVNFGGSFSGILGYAQFPTLSGLEGVPEDGLDFTDGIVIGYQYFGTTDNVAAPFNKGRTTTHEVGHWLGLRHIWGDGDCGVDDYCADTPNADGPNYSCEFRDSCPEPGDDMIENYMDYSTDACMNIFTQDQRTRIRTVLNVSPRRKSLIACQQAPLAVEGNNTSDQPRTWFEYTANENQLVKISSIAVATVDTKLSLYQACNALPMLVSDNAQGSEQSELAISLLQGETVKILWEASELIEPFEWTLSTSAPEQGAACDLAVVAVEGVNTVPATDLSTYWYQFTPSAAQQKVFIDAGGKSFTVYGHECAQLNPLKSSSSSLTIYDVADTETLWIAFEARGGNFDWSLSEDALRVGESCATAVAASEGQNVIPYDAPFEYWYSFTMPQTGKLRVYNTNNRTQGSARVAIFRSCEGYLLTEATDSTGWVLQEGETVNILWEGTTTTANFEWTLEAATFENGEICAVAKPATLGMNHTDGAPQWFTYTTTKFSNLKISAVGFSEVDTHLMLKRECDGPVIMDNDNLNSAEMYSSQSEIVIYGVDAGKKFYIHWADKWSFEGFDWIIEELEPLPGDNCQTAKQAVIGTNTVDYNPGHPNFGGLFWAKYIVPSSNKKITAYCSKPIDMAIYAHDNCESYYYIDSEQGLSRAFNLPAGTELIFIWESSQYKEDFTWELSVEPIEQGDLCTKPKRAVVGSNTTESNPIWYDYVMSQDGSIKLSFESAEATPVIPNIFILDGCGEQANLLFGGQGEAFVSGLNQGDRLLFYWNIGYPFTGFTWSLAETARKQGDTCQDPIVVNAGLNHAEYATQWFSYTPATTGNVKISSRPFTFSNTDLYVYDGCNGELLASSDNVISWEDFTEYFQSEVLIENVEAERTLLIQWAGTYSFESFNWEITDGSPRQGDSCEDPLVAVEGINNGMKPAPAWFTFTMPRTAALTLSTLGYAETNTNVEVYDACNGNLLASNDDAGGDAQSMVHLEELEEGQTILIRWANSLASELNTFDWRLIVGQPEQGIFCEFPTTAAEGLNTLPNYTSNYYWYSFTMPEDNKKLIINRLDATPAFYRTLGITEDCNRFVDYAISEDHVEVTGLSAGQQVMIFFGELVSGEREGFDWELSIEDLQVGDACSNPIDALPGMHNTSGASTWYLYSAPLDGDLLLTSANLDNLGYANTYVEVYDACDGNLIASHDNPDDWSHYHAELLLENVEAGQSYWINWSTVAPFQTPFQWWLSLENSANSAPLLEDVVFKMPVSVTNGRVLGTLTANDEDNDELLYRITAGNESGAFSLNQTSGELSIIDASQINQDLTQIELEVTVTDKVVATTAMVRIDIVSAIEHNGAGNIIAYPNPAADRLFIEILPDVIVYQSQIIDLKGNVVKVNKTTDREISLTSLNQGMYVLKVFTNQGMSSFKISIIK